MNVSYENMMIYLLHIQVNNQTESICTDAVSKNGINLINVRNQSYDVCMTAITNPIFDIHISHDVKDEDTGVKNVKEFINVPLELRFLVIRDEDMRTKIRNSLDPRLQMTKRCKNKS